MYNVLNCKYSLYKLGQHTVDIQCWLIRWLYGAISSSSNSTWCYFFVNGKVLVFILFYCTGKMLGTESITNCFEAGTLHFAHGTVVPWLAVIYYLRFKKHCNGILKTFTSLTFYFNAEVCEFFLRV